MKYRVMAETKQGTLRVLKGGFRSQDDALDYPVRLSNYESVWVEKETQMASIDRSPPKLPLRIHWASSRAYLVDDDGKPVAALMGTIAKQTHTTIALAPVLNTDDGSDR